MLPVPSCPVLLKPVAHAALMGLGAAFVTRHTSHDTRHASPAPLESRNSVCASPQDAEVTAQGGASVKATGWGVRESWAAQRQAAGAGEE